MLAPRSAEELAVPSVDWKVVLLVEAKDPGLEYPMAALLVHQ